MIIVEGPDGAGKSTLVKQLQDLFPELKTGERGTDNRDLLWTVTRSDTYNAMRLALTPEEPPRIWDRLFWSEFVYSPVVGRECQFTDEDIALIPQVIAALKAPVIMCGPSFEVVQANAQRAHQMDGVNDGLARIYDSYKQIVGIRRYFPPKLNLIPYDYTSPEERFPYIAEQVAQFIQDRPA